MKRVPPAAQGTRSGLLGIGALSRATGVPVDTLRTWERRYGFPKPERTPSGHRKYPARAVDRLRLVKQALEFGHRASSVVPLTEGALAKLLALGTAVDREPPAPASAAAPDSLQIWFDAALGLDGRALERAMREAWTAVGARRFIDDFAVPFAVGTGDRWAKGDIGVRHEHFASERLRDLLSTEWRTLAASVSGPAVVLATLPGERHDLPLHMAAVVLALAQFEVVFLGASTPPLEIARAVREHSAVAVVLTVSACAERKTARAQMRELRGALDPDVLIAAGGQGLSEPPTGIEHIEEFSLLVDRLSHHAPRRSGRWAR
ncbi:MAG: MerR family transcriptional regulator [Polyangiaceae bacterium]|nr:MerR family transcriptional regulator [Polyangiaceae bacterium]